MALFQANIRIKYLLKQKKRKENKTQTILLIESSRMNWNEWMNERKNKKRINKI